MTTFPNGSRRAVPARYRGVWRRTLLAAPGLRDTSTTVLWLQTPHWHADLRIPAGRPDFSGVDGLGQCSAEQKAWLAGQQGFAGVTEVAEHAGAELCTWHRVMDFQPPSPTPDAGTMRFAPDRLVETGIHQAYVEHWIKLPESENGFAVLERADAGDARAFPPEMLFVAGEFVMHVRDRATQWNSGIDNGVAFREAVRSEEQGALLDMEISFGKRTLRGWKIQHALSPWREQQDIAVTMFQDVETLTLDIDGVAASWRVLEWLPPENPGARPSGMPSENITYHEQK